MHNELYRSPNVLDRQKSNGSISLSPLSHGASCQNLDQVDQTVRYAHPPLRGVMTITDLNQVIREPSANRLVGETKRTAQKYR